jgi:hypothetical protein
MGEQSKRALRPTYGLQVLQLVAEHVAQELPPATGVDTPSALLEKEAKDENIRFALAWQRGQEMRSSAWPCGRSASNLRLQSGQQYS